MSSRPGTDSPFDDARLMRITAPYAAPIRWGDSRELFGKLTTVSQATILRVANFTSDEAAAAMATGLANVNDPGAQNRIGNCMFGHAFDYEWDLYKGLIKVKPPQYDPYHQMLANYGSADYSTYVLALRAKGYTETQIALSLSRGAPGMDHSSILGSNSAGLMPLGVVKAEDADHNYRNYSALVVDPDTGCVVPTREAGFIDADRTTKGNWIRTVLQLIVVGGATFGVGSMLAVPAAAVGTGAAAGTVGAPAVTGAVGVIDQAAIIAELEIQQAAALTLENVIASTNAAVAAAGSVGEAFNVAPSVGWQDIPTPKGGEAPAPATDYWSVVKGGVSTIVKGVGAVQAAAGLYAAITHPAAGADPLTSATGTPQGGGAQLAQVQGQTQAAAAGLLSQQNLLYIGLAFIGLIILKKAAA